MPEMVLASRMVPFMTMRTAVESGRHANLDDLVCFWLGFAATQAAGEVDIHGFGQKAGLA